MEENKKLGVFALAAIVISAMIGGGIFSLPQNMAQSASAGAVALAWLITGIGIFFLANTFRILAGACPEETTGIYAYARLAFGRFAGFQMAWSYWLSNVFGNVAYAVLLMDALDYFFPGVFTGGNNLASIIGGSLVIWIMNFAVLRGVRQAAFMNLVGTICKLVPIALFIVIMIAVFKFGIFLKGSSHVSGSLLEQIKSTMPVTLWAFIGIEGAVVISARAKSQKAVGAATIMGFLGCLFIYIMLSLLPFGRMTQPEIASLANPSTAPVLSDVVGHWGGVVMNLGVIISLLTSWLAFTIMVAQIPYAAAKDGTFPAVFSRANQNDSPSVSLWVTSAVMQMAMIFVYFENNAWNTMLSVTAVMILPPYLASTACLWKIAASKGCSRFAKFCGFAGTLYGLWMIYAAGVQFMLMAFVFLAVGIPFFIRARKDAGDEMIMTGRERFAAALIVAVAILAVILFSAGIVKL